MKNIKSNLIAQFISGIFGGTILGIAGFLGLMAYGGNYGCWAFADRLFGLVGYESCGKFGSILGLMIGVIAGVLLFKIFKVKNPSRTSKILTSLTILIPLIFGIIFISPPKYWPQTSEPELFMLLMPILHFAFFSAIVSALLTGLINWRSIFKK